MTEPAKTFVGKTTPELHLAGLGWLERAARLALDEGTMFETGAGPDSDVSNEAHEIAMVGDKLIQQRNIAEAALAAQIGHSLIMAALGDNDADANPERYYSGHSRDPVR
jgi:hypothetical protein